MTDQQESKQQNAEHQDWRALLRELDVTPSKALGQNFLHDRKIVQRIARVAEIDPETDVLEIGPGLGILTNELVAQARSVTAIELDSRLAERLSTFFRNEARIIEGDILQIDLASVVLPSPYIVVANLPYSIATAAIQRLLEADHPPDRMIIMVQREVAERMVARPPDMSILAVAVQFYGRSRIAFRIGSGAFIPRPRVESAVVRIDLDQPPLPRASHAAFFRLVKAGFSQRRKRLDNAMSSGLKAPKSVVADALLSAGVDPARRAETLDVSEWVRVFEFARSVLDATN